jgi:hypothetical protein
LGSARIFSYGFRAIIHLSYSKGRLLSMYFLCQILLIRISLLTIGWLSATSRLRYIYIYIYNTLIKHPNNTCKSRKEKETGEMTKGCIVVIEYSNIK